MHDGFFFAMKKASFLLISATIIGLIVFIVLYYIFGMEAAEAKSVGIMAAVVGFGGEYLAAFLNKFFYSPGFRLRKKKIK